MSALDTALIDGLIERERQVGATITYAGAEYPCSAGVKLGGKELGAGGYRVTAQAQIVVRQSVLNGAVPQEKQLLDYRRCAGADAERMRIVSVTKILGAAFLLECNSATEGA